MQIQFFNGKPKTNYLIYPFFKNELGAMGPLLRDNVSIDLNNFIKEHSALIIEQGDIKELICSKDGHGISLLLVNMGDREALEPLKVQAIAGKVVTFLNANKVEQADLIIESDKEWMVVDFLFGAKNKLYVFDKYFVHKAEKMHNKFTLLNVITAGKSTFLAEEFAEKSDLLKGIYSARNLVSEPPCFLYPAAFADKMVEELVPLGVEVTVLGIPEMEKLGMNAILAVGQGSVRESKFLIMKWNGANSAKEKPIALVGKGVTFDTGGINLKPSSAMEGMHYDMTGAAVVCGVMEVLARRRLKANVIGIAPLVENMPSGNAQRPGDVIFSMSGMTIEVDNTDAEGRLILADALSYVQEKHDPELIIDLATLTGAMIVALGDYCAGLFSNNSDLTRDLLKSAEQTGDLLWEMPLADYYDKQINSMIADVKNTGEGRGAGSITAAQFLKRFINNDRKWAHIDIAGVSWSKNPTDTKPKGATGFGVQLLYDFIKNKVGG